MPFAEHAGESYDSTHEPLTEGRRTIAIGMITLEFPIIA